MFCRAKLSKETMLSIKGSLLIFNWIFSLFLQQQRRECWKKKKEREICPLTLGVGRILWACRHQVGMKTLVQDCRDSVPIARWQHHGEPNGKAEELVGKGTQPQEPIEWMWDNLIDEKSPLHLAVGRKKSLVRRLNYSLYKTKLMLCYFVVEHCKERLKH